MDAFVFRRSPAGGGEGSDFCFDVFRESHEKGLVNFLVTGGAAIVFSCMTGGAGGGGNFTGDIRPDSPCMALEESRESLGGSFGSSPAAFASSGYRQLVRPT